MPAYPVHNSNQHSLQLKNLHPVISVSPIADVHPSEVRLINQLIIGQVLADILKQQLVLLAVASINISSFPLHMLRGLASLDSRI